MLPCHVCFLFMSRVIMYLFQSLALDHLGVCMQGEHNLLSAAIAGVRVLMPLCSSSSHRISLVYIATRRLSYSMEICFRNSDVLLFHCDSLFSGDSDFAILLWSILIQLRYTIFSIVTSCRSWKCLYICLMKSSQGLLYSSSCTLCCDKY